MWTQHIDIIWRIHYTLLDYTIKAVRTLGRSLPLLSLKILHQITIKSVCIISTVKVKIIVCRLPQETGRTPPTLTYVLQCWLRSNAWRGFFITRSVNTPLPAPWQHSWECRMFTCLETIYLAISKTPFLRLMPHGCLQFISSLLKLIGVILSK